MMLSEQLEQAEDVDESDDWNCTTLYCSVMHEHQQVVVRKKGYLYHSTRWLAMTPAGNIYRYLALASERHRNCEDIWQQLDGLADKYAHLLGGQEQPLEARTKALCKALEQTVVHGALEAEEGEQVVGFKPLEEFFSTRVVRIGPFLFPTDSQQFMDWLTHRAIGAMICLIQWIAPLVIFLDEWSSAENKLRDPQKFLGGLRFKELFCLGLTFKDKMTTLMGGILLQLVILIIHSYILKQHTDCKKSGMLPNDNFWYILGNITNQVCTMLTFVATPLLFWNEDTPTDMAMDSLSILFIFCLDDFAGQATTYMDKSETLYMRSAAWHKGLLTQCPVRLSDLINPTAAKSSELWSIRYNASGELLVAQGKDLEKREVCRRRLQRVELQSLGERTPLVSREEPETRSLVRFWYQSGLGVPGRVLPGLESSTLALVWSVMDKLSLVVQFLLPLAWMAVNRPCKH